MKKFSHDIDRDIDMITYSSMSESESPWANRANNDPSSAPTTRQEKLRKIVSEIQKINDARPVGVRRPRYAASGEVICTGDGEGGREPVEEPKERSGEAGEEDK